ncbi:Uncharacterised protein [Brucella suis]|nr:Uncharacterised protein [Brucella suis]
MGERHRLFQIEGDRDHIVLAFGGERHPLGSQGRASIVIGSGEIFQFSRCQVLKPVGETAHHAKLEAAIGVGSFHFNR